MFITDSATAIAIPGSTPRKTTPRNAAIESAHSDRRCFQSRTVPGMSASDSDAAITTAASVGWGRSRNRPGTNRSIAAIVIAPTSPATCVLAPDCSATAVRDPLVLTGKPWNSPAPRFAAPMPIISLVAVDLLAGATGEGRRRRDRVGQRDERDAQRATDQRGQVGPVHVREGEGRKPFRQRAHQLDPVLIEVEGSGHGDRRDHGDQHARDARQHSPQDGDHRQRQQADGERGGHRLAVADAVDESPQLVDEAVSVDREAEELRELARPGW